MRADSGDRRPAAWLRGLLVALLIAGVALVALGATGHSHARGDVRDHAAASAQRATTVDPEVGAVTSIAGDGSDGAEGVCLAVTLVGLVMSTIIHSLLAHRIAAARPASPPLPTRRPWSPAQRCPAAPDLTRLAVCRQ
jgi:hypothetical protein